MARTAHGLDAAADGHPVRPRFVLLLVVALAAAACTRPQHDYDGDGKADLVWIGTDTGTWVAGPPGDERLLFAAEPDDQPVPADYDGDNVTDIVVVRDDRWWIRADGSVLADLPSPADVGLAASTVTPVPADYDGDGRAEPAWHRGFDATWFLAGRAPVVFGNGASDRIPNPDRHVVANLDFDQPVPADYDGDRWVDLASYSPLTGAWQVRSSRYGTVSNTVLRAPVGRLQWPAPADYDGVNHAQRALLDPDGWLIEGRSGPVGPPSAGPDDVALPAPADHDGDRRAEPAYVVFRYPDRQWTWHGTGSTTVGPVVGGRPSTLAWSLLVGVARFTFLARCQAEPDPAYC